MAYELIKLGNFSGERVFLALKSLGFDMKKAQNLCDKARIRDINGKILAKNDIIFGELFIIDYVCKPKGLKPIFECNDFAVFDKPSGICSHPNGRNSTYNMYDEIWHLFGKNACVVHRLDAQTSGLLLVAKNKNSAKILKQMFENREVLKAYVAFVSGKILENELDKFNLEYYQEFKHKLKFLQNFSGYVIDKSMDLGELVGQNKRKMKICDNSKRAITLLKILKFFPDKDCTMVECFPLTGRQHQIRLHLFHVKHKILGDTLYGLSNDEIEMILDNKMTQKERIKCSGANRLMLHAKFLSFCYMGENYNFYSKQNFEF